MSTKRAGRSKSKSSSRWSSRWNTATSCLRKRRCWSAGFSSAGGTKRSEMMTTSARWRDFLRGLVQRREQRGLAGGLHAARAGRAPARDARRRACVGISDRAFARRSRDRRRRPAARRDRRACRRAGARSRAGSRLLRAEAHRAAGVDEQAEAEVGVGLELLDVKAVAAGPRCASRAGGCRRRGRICGTGRTRATSRAPGCGACRRRCRASPAARAAAARAAARARRDRGSRAVCGSAGS